MTTEVFEDVYYGQVRPEVLALVPDSARRMLELGCGYGKMAAALKARQECQVTGIEYVQRAAECAAEHLDRVIVADCEQVDFETAFGSVEFDCVIAADVLEHLRDPEAMLLRLLPYLTSDAVIVVSIPNVRNAGVLEAAVRGRWTYEKWGILDRTHLRFFTRREIECMFQRLGFQTVAAERVAGHELEQWERLNRPTSVSFGALSVEDLDETEVGEFFVVQWLFRFQRAREATPVPFPDSQKDIGAAPAFAVTPSLTSRLRAEYLQELEFSERLQSALVQAENAVTAGARTNQLIRSKLVDAEARLRRLQSQLTAARSQKDELEKAYARVIAERDIADRNLRTIQASTSWRLTSPLRGVVRRRPGVASARRLARRLGARRVLARTATTRRVLRRIARVAWLALTLQLPSRVVARTHSHQYSTRHHRLLNTNISEAAPVFVPDRLVLEADSQPSPQATKGRLICLTHLLPEPPQAGNEYRVNQMLNWLAAHGWDVLLLVCPAADQEPSAARIRQAARAYPNIIVCQRDGRLLYRLQDGSIRLEDLRGRQPRAFSALLGEVPTNESEQRVNSLLRTVCPDVLIEVLLQVEAKWHPNVVLGEYVFMTRVFPLLDPRALKVVDTHDVFSTINRKVAQYGIDDVLALPAEAEGQLLNRADLVVAIQPEEAEVLRELTPLRNVITVGVDFRLREDMPPPDDRPIILFVGSANPKNVKGLRDFVRFAWPLVKDAMPDAELRVVGGVGHRLDTTVDGINILGHVDDLEAEYAAASVVINPAVAGTGLKVKTLESICHMRPIVVWPSGVDGMGPEIQSMCSVATNWFEFARSVIDLAKADDAIQHLVDRAAELNRLFDSDTVYAPLAAALDNAVAQPVVAGS